MLGLSALVGQQEAVRHLVRLIASGRLPHALLFEGPQSTGKSTAARLLGQALFCRTPGTPPGESCGHCPGCAKMAADTHGDWHFVTTEKKQIQVGLIREAMRTLDLRPVEGGVKMLVVEDADRMNPAAQNALLKTLEEPPGAAHIILTTSRLRAILPTVVSRCQRVHFAPLPVDALTRLVAESRGLPEPQARMVAALAQGSLGTAMAMDFEAVVADRDRVAALDLALFGRTPQGALDALEQASELAGERAACIAALDLLLVWLHDQVLLASGAPTDSLANLDRLADLNALAEARGLAAILARAEDVLEARRQLEAPYNWSPQLITEQLCLALAGHGRLERVPL